MPLRRTSQCNQHPGCATLYLDCSAASEDLFDTARRRLESAIGTLSVLDCSGQPIPDSGLSFSSATAGGNPSLN
ncbi:hypothetical protein A8O37_19380 [Pseudomonas aeruginosa]|nr:hypothetical protein A8O37_19380 [Pseudomonas aeruginosa]